MEDNAVKYSPEEYVNNDDFYTNTISILTRMQLIYVM